MSSSEEYEEEDSPSQRAHRLHQTTLRVASSSSSSVNHAAAASTPFLVAPVAPQSLEKTFETSLQALAQTREHTQSSAKQAEEAMAEKLRRKGKQVAAVVETASATSSVSATTAVPAASASSSERKKKPKSRAVRFADVSEEDEEQSAAEDEEKSNSAAASSITASAPAAAAVPSISDFDAYLASHFSDSVSEIASRAASIASTSELAASISAPTLSKDIPDVISIDPIALGSFLHLNSPLPRPSVPSLQQLCCAALSHLRNYPLRPEEYALFEILPSHCLVECVEGVKRPQAVGVAAAAGTAAAELSTTLPPATSESSAGDESSPTYDANKLQEFQLLAFLHPHLHRFSLEPKLASSSSSSSSGSSSSSSAHQEHDAFNVVVGLPDGYVDQITEKTIDRVLGTCTQMLELDLSGYASSFNIEQLHSLTRLSSLHSLTLTHCSLLGGEFDLLTRGLPTLTEVNVGWTSFLVTEGGMEDLLAAVQRLSGSLKTLSVDGCRANPNELLCKLLQHLVVLSHLSMDSVSAPAKRLSREEEEQEKRKQRAIMLAGKAGGQEGGEEGESEQQMIDQLVADNMKLKTTLLQEQQRITQLVLQRQQQNQPSSNGLSSDSTSSSGHFPHFLSLSAIGSASLSPETLLLLVSNAPHLQHLLVKGCNGGVTEEVMGAIIYGCRELRTLNVADCQGVESESVRAMYEATLPVGRRSIGRMKNAVASGGEEEKGDDQPASSPSASSIASSLSLSLLLSSLPASPSHLTSLDFSWCENVCNDALAGVMRMRNDDAEQGREYGLERVILSCLEEVDSSTISLLRRHRYLQELDVSRCLHLAAKDIFIMDEDGDDGQRSSALCSPAASLFASPISLPPSWSHLLRLNISWTTVENSDVAHLVALCPKLQTLVVEGCKHLNDGCITHFLQSPAAMMNLTHLSIFFVNHISLHGIVQLLMNSTAYWLVVKDYYGDLHSRATLAQDIREARSS